MSLRRTDRLDEDDVRVRPSGHSRPRSRLRPTFEGALPALVTAVDRGRYTCQLLADGRQVLAMKSRELGKKGVVVGDRVGLVGDTGDTVGALSRIVRVEERVSVLRRTADDNDPFERVIVANADQLVIVTSVRDPEPRTGLIDRCLVAAYDSGLRPLLCITKTDLAAPTELLRIYGPLAVDHVTTRRGGDLAEVRAALRGRTSVLVGHSGVGKSTLVNALVPGVERVTGPVNVVTGRGRHVSSSAIALRLPDGDGWVIDTPGLRSFGLAHVDQSRVIHAFPELEAGTAECPRACTHEPGECALDAYVTAQGIDPQRLASLRRLLASRD